MIDLFHHPHQVARLLLKVVGVLVIVVVVVVDSTPFMSSKKIMCGTVTLDENAANRQEQQQSQLELVFNLTHCLHLVNEHNYTSFRSLHGSKLASHLFDVYFQLNESTGLVYMKPGGIDRERLCLDAKQQRQQQQLLQRSLAGDVGTSSTVSCECRSPRCELNFKFIGFRDAVITTNSKRRRIQQHQQSSDQEYKYLILRVAIRDLNDHKPRFHKSFLTLNISEHFGTQSTTTTTKTSSSTSNTRNSIECTAHKLNLGFNYPLEESEEYLNSLLALDKAHDMDTGPNARIDYKLFLLSRRLDNELDEQTDAVKRRDRVEKLLSETRRPCAGLFELVIESPTSESSSAAVLPSSQRFNNDDFNYESAAVAAAVSLVGENEKKWTNKAAVLPVANNEQLFLKINTYLDREIQQVIFLLFVLFLFNKDFYFNPQSFVAFLAEILFY